MAIPLSTNTTSGVAPLCWQPKHCPRFFTFVARLAHNTRSQQRERRAFDLNTTLTGIALNVQSLAESQPCFCSYIYTNVPDLEAVPGLRVADALRALHPSVIAAPFPKLSRNRWGDPTVSWNALSFAKLDVAVLHLVRGEKVIWTDVDTLLVYGLQHAYRKLPNFVVCDKSMEDARAGRGCYGDLWMVDPPLAAAVYSDVARLPNSQLPPYDLQGIFTRLLARGGENGARLHNLVKETGAMCWGFDFAGHNHPYAVNSSILLPHHPGETRIALAADAIGGPLRCSLPERPGPMLPVGAMSFTWPSFKEMMRRPEALWYGPGVRRWFTRTYCEKRAASRGWNPLASVCRRAADCTLEPPCHARGVERGRGAHRKPIGRRSFNKP